MGKLEGKSAIVTGASRGIGQAIARLFAAEGAKVVCAARTLREGDSKLEGSLQSTVEQIREAGGSALAVACNVGEEEECRRLVETAIETYGALDVLVNNAAINWLSKIVEYQPLRWQRGFAVNIHGPFFLSHYALPGMIERRGGAIVNISSGSAIGPGRGPYSTVGFGQGMYGASKAALERFTQELAQEVFEYGISVTCFGPSQIVPTPAVTHFQGRGGPGADPAASEPPEIMAKAALLLATEPYDKVSGRVTYSQQILEEYGLLPNARGTGIDRPGSGFSQI